MTVSIPHPTRQVLINAALDLFAAEGVRATTVRKIEEAAGLSPGAGGMYRHFRSKDELLLAAVEAYFEEVLVFADALPATLELNDLRAELRQAATTFREFNERHEALVRVMLLDGLDIPAPARERMEEAWEQGYGLYATWLRKRLRPGTPVDIEATAIQLFGSLANFHAQFKTFARAPMNVDNERFVESWVEHWATFLENAPS
jgi:AcrR family transcriptional regulator